MKQLAILAELIGGGAFCGWVNVRMMETDIRPELGVLLYLALCTVVAIVLCLPWMLTE